MFNFIDNNTIISVFITNDNINNTCNSTHTISNISGNTVITATISCNIYATAISSYIAATPCSKAAGPAATQQVYTPKGAALYCRDKLYPSSTIINLSSNICTTTTLGSRSDPTTIHTTMFSSNGSNHTTTTIHTTSSSIDYTTTIIGITGTTHLETAAPRPDIRTEGLYNFNFFIARFNKYAIILTTQRFLTITPL